MGGGRCAKGVRCAKCRAIHGTVDPALRPNDLWRKNARCAIPPSLPLRLPLLHPVSGPAEKLPSAVARPETKVLGQEEPDLVTKNETATPLLAASEWEVWMKPAARSPRDGHP